MGFGEQAHGFWRTGCGLLTAVHLAKVIATRFRTYKLTGGRLELFDLSRDAARKKNFMVAWEALLKWGGSCGIREQPVASLSSSA